MRKPILFALIALGAAISVMAGDGIPMGNAVFYPSVEAVYTHTDNLFLTDPNMGSYGNVSDSFWSIRPTLGFEFPFKESYIRLDLGYQYKDYDTYTLSSHDSYLGDFKSNFKFSNRAVLRADVRYFRGVQEVNEFDPGYERYFANTPFDRWDINIGADFALDKYNTFGFYGLYDTVHFSENSDTANPWFDYDQWGGGLTWKYHFRPESSLVLNTEYITNSPHYDAHDLSLYTVGQRDYDSWKFTVGWEGDASRVMNGYAKVGYQNMHFKSGYDWWYLPYYNPYYQPYWWDWNGSNFSGFIFDAGLGFRATETLKFDLKLNRSPYQSTYNMNNYYTATGGTLQIQQQVSRYLFWSAGFLYQENAYPDSTKALYDPNTGFPVYEYWMTQGEFRKDKIDRAYAEIGVHLTKQFSMRANYQHEKRDSNIHYYDYLGDHTPYSYSENRFSVQAQLGW